MLSFSWLLPHFRVNVTFTLCYYIPHYWVHNTVLRTQHTFRSFLFFGSFPILRLPIDEFIIILVIRSFHDIAQFELAYLPTAPCWTGFPIFPCFPDFVTKINYHFRIQGPCESDSWSGRYFEHLEKVWIHVRHFALLSTLSQTGLLYYYIFLK